MPLSPSEQLLYNSVRIESFSNSKPLQTGTGFYWRTSIDNSYTETIVTSKHVIKGASHLQVRIHTHDGGGNPTGTTQLATISLGAGGIVMHPDNSVDLCAITVSSLYKHSEMTGTQFFYVPLEASILPTSQEWTELDALEEALMIGCPNGLFDEHNNLPLFRRGNTASHPGYS